jgi:hypothetical protein
MDLSQFGYFFIGRLLKWKERVQGLAEFPHTRS